MSISMLTLSQFDFKVVFNEVNFKMTTVLSLFGRNMKKRTNAEGATESI